MAGRPVAARGGGMLYGLIAFVIVAVAALVGFFLQLTSNEALRSSNDSLQRKLNQYGTPSQYYLNEATARGSSAFAVMNGDLEDLALLTTGKKDALRPAIVESANHLLEQVASTTPPGTIEPSDTLLTALRKLHAAYLGLKKEHTDLTTDLAEQRDENESLRAGFKTVRDDFAQGVAAQKEETAQIQQEKTELLAAKDEQLAKQQAEAEAVGEELSRTKVEQQRTDRDHEIAMARVRSDLEGLRDRIRELKPEGFDPYEILRKADGRVLRAIPGSDVVYIDLGRADHVHPGLTFEVFSPTGGERTEGVRGKASIEVTAPLETTAECRVTRSTPGRPIVEGDIIVNIAYERNRLPEFVVRGEFDLDYNGEKDLNGIERVDAIIRAWGGQVVDQINESTDFLVIGMGPQPPLPAPGRPISDVIQSLTDARLKQLDKYRQDIELAQTYYIPVITQTQFLFLTGYSGHGAILTE